MVRLRTVTPGIARAGRAAVPGGGFAYVDDAGARLPAEDVERIKSLVIPPAWEDVWICPLPNGHIQAVGIDAAGRKQYLYHPDWRIKRDQLKFDRVLEVARELSTTRAAVLEHLRARRDAARAGRRDRRTPARPRLLPDRLATPTPTTTAASG